MTKSTKRRKMRADSGLRERRERLQLSRPTLAVRVGISVATLNRWEQEVPLIVRNFAALCAELGVTVERLLKDGAP